jgi:hypothetical protein
MASRVSVRWFWRDVRLVYGLLIWAACGAGVLLYFNGGVSWQAAAPAPQRVASDDELYTGSIVVVPTQGDRCWQMMLDNRTGRMWEGGYLDCDAVVDALTDSKRTGASAVRLNAIGSAFRGQ